MNKWQVVSDIHIEKLYPNVPNYKDYFTVESENGTLVMCGDIGNIHTTELLQQLIKFIQQFANEYRVIYYIPGNHEYINNRTLTMEKCWIQLKKLEDYFEKLFVVDNLTKIVSISNQKKAIVFFSTYWSYIPDTIKQPSAIISNNKRNCDIKPLTNSEWNILHFQARVELENAIKTANELELNLYVFTHYSPTFQNTLDPKYRVQGNKQLHLYCSEEEFYLKKPVKVWCFGHTGFNCDNSYKETRLVSNQVNKNLEFKNLVIKLK